MQTLDMEDRRYQRLKAHVPVLFHGCEAGSGMAAETLDVSTGGGAILLWDKGPTCCVGDQVHVELDLGNQASPFRTQGTVCNVVAFEPSEMRPRGTRIGVKFQEAFLLETLPASAA